VNPTPKSLRSVRHSYSVTLRSSRSKCDVQEAVPPSYTYQLAAKQGSPVPHRLRHTSIWATTTYTLESTKICDDLYCLHMSHMSITNIAPVSTPPTAIPICRYLRPHQQIPLDSGISGAGDSAAMTIGLDLVMVLRSMSWFQ